ncbi:MAG: FAD synthetase [Rikenellaceae bacterium]
MKIFYGFNRISFIKNAVCTVGSYDGVHVGHKRLIERCKERAAQIGGESVVLTFEPHPRIVLGRGEGLKLLTTIDEKVELLRECGVDNVVVIPFDLKFSKLSYSDFVVHYLIEKLHMKSMVVGYNHLFGHKNEGNLQHLSDLAAQHDFTVDMLPELRNDDSKVSSTVIRKLIEVGDIEQANSHMGANYLIMRYRNKEPLKLLPPAGRYVARVDGVECEVQVSTQGEVTTTVEEYKKIEIIKTIELC